MYYLCLFNQHGHTTYIEYTSIKGIYSGIFQTYIRVPGSKEYMSMRSSHNILQTVII